MNKIVRQSTDRFQSDDDESRYSEIAFDLDQRKGSRQETIWSINKLKVWKELRGRKNNLYINFDYFDVLVSQSKEQELKELCQTWACEWNISTWENAFWKLLKRNNNVIFTKSCHSIDTWSVCLELKRLSNHSTKSNKSMTSNVRIRSTTRWLHVVDACRNTHECKQTGNDSMVWSWRFKKVKKKDDGKAKIN